MPVLGTQVTSIIHENLAVVMTYAFSIGPLIDMRVSKFAGQWKYLEKAIFTIPESRANRAAIELALMFRILDDSEAITSSSFRGYDFGRLYLTDGQVAPLPLRE